MQLKAKTIRVIVLLATGALLGLMVIQVYLLNNAMQLKKQAFRQNVNAALTEVVQKLETRDIAHHVVKVALNVDDVKADSGDTVRRSMDRDFLLKVPPPTSQASDSSVRKTTYCFTRRDSAGTVVEEVETFYDGAEPGSAFNFTVSGDDSLAYIVGVHETDSTHAYSYAVNNQKALVEKVIRQLGEKTPPVSERVNQAQLDSLLLATLGEKDIDTRVVYGVILSTPKDSVVLSNVPELRDTLLKTDYRSVLFPSDIFVRPDQLAVYFPGERFYLLQQVSLSVGVSLFFILLLTGCFIYTIRTIFRQRDFAQRLTGFINNMVHEFKTPISTIALASESLARPANLENTKKLKRYTGIIRDENSRMREQVEKILQMAVLEEGDFELNLARTDLHILLEGAIQKVALQVEQRNGRISAQLHATQHSIQADALHLANIIHNLLDNAMKYTSRAPEIIVATRNEDSHLIIEIQDNGIGLSPEDGERVFEKYYRVPTGNLHDVKGFGLGLSYVKLMVQAHGGEIAVTSETGKGSCFCISFPLSE